MSEVWLITGASRGLGRAFTEEALKSGHRVVATARNSEHLVDVASKFGESVRTVPARCHERSAGKVRSDVANEAFGGLDVLVNNAGYGNVSSGEDTSLADLRAQIETNLFGVIIMTKAVLPYSVSAGRCCRPLAAR
jgi:NAD(P)-dependent dehydrogenase (short-subunit alcohol dehydrogenase family)